MANLLSFYSRVTDKIQERDGWVDCVYLDLKRWGLMVGPARSGAGECL